MTPRASTGPLALSALLLFTAPAAGQGLGIGAEAGINVSDVSFEGEAETESNTGLRVGGVLRLGLSSVLGLQTGAYFSEKGTTDVTEPDVDIDLDLSYVEIPLLLNVRIPTGPAPVTPRLYAGPQLALETGCDISATGDGASATTSCDEASQEGDLEVDTKSTDLSVVFGGGLDIAAGPGAITLDARYDLGVSDINELETGTDFENRSLSVAAGYLFTLP